MKLAKQEIVEGNIWQLEKTEINYVFQMAKLYAREIKVFHHTRRQGYDAYSLYTKDLVIDVSSQTPHLIKVMQLHNNDMEKVLKEVEAVWVQYIHAAIKSSLSKAPACVTFDDVDYHAPEPLVGKLTKEQVQDILGITADEFENKLTKHSPYKK